MEQTRTDPVLAARALVDALPTLIEQASASGGRLALAVYAMRTALAEAKRVARESGKPGGASISTVEALRRLGD